MCWVKEELKKQVVGGRRGEGDPGIHVHGTRRKLLALTSLATPALQPGALLQAQSTKDRHSQSNLLHFHLAGREGGELKKKKNPIIFICASHQVQRKMQTGETAAVNSLYFTQKIVYLFIAYRNYLFEKIYPFSRT